MSSSIVLQRPVQEKILSHIDQTSNLVFAKVPKNILKDQARLVSKEWTRKDWDYLVATYSEKEIWTFFFDDNKGNYLLYKKAMDDEKAEKTSILAGNNEYLLTENDADCFHNYVDEMTGKEATKTDHMPSLKCNKLYVGTDKAEKTLNEILMEQYPQVEFTLNGLREFAMKHGKYLTPKRAEIELPVINKMIRENRFFTAEKSGLVTMMDETKKTIIRNCAKKGVSPELSDALVGEGEKIVKHVNQSLARNIADAVTETDNDKRQKKGNKLLRNLAELLNIQVEPLGGGSY